MSDNDRSVFRRDGLWHNKLDGNTKSSSIHSTQKEANIAAKTMLENSSTGGELKIMGLDGRIRSKDTINRPDPFPPKDTEN